MFSEIKFSFSLMYTEPIKCSINQKMGMRFGSENLVLSKHMIGAGLISEELILTAASGCSVENESCCMLCALLMDLLLLSVKDNKKLPVI